MIIHSTTLDTEAKVIAIYGGTSWSKIEGRFLLGQSASHVVNSTGGSETVTLTLNQIPSHNHSYTRANQGRTDVSGAQTAPQSAMNGYGWVSTEYAGGGQAHDNMPPFKTVYIWERTA